MHLVGPVGVPPAQPRTSGKLSAGRPESPRYTDVMARVQPTLEWYKTTSRDGGGAPRCPFASVQRCPRFYESVSLLGEAGFTTAIPRETDDRLCAIWQQSDLWPTVREQAASIMGPADDPRHLMNFCPEVLYCHAFSRPTMRLRAMPNWRPRWQLLMHSDAPALI